MSRTRVIISARVRVIVNVGFRASVRVCVIIRFRDIFSVRVIFKVRIRVSLEWKLGVSVNSANTSL
jgi:hypothetical protein